MPNEDQVLSEENGSQESTLEEEFDSNSSDEEESEEESEELSEPSNPLSGFTIDLEQGQLSFRDALGEIVILDAEIYLALKTCSVPRCGMQSYELSVSRLYKPYCYNHFNGVSHDREIYRPDLDPEKNLALQLTVFASTESGSFAEINKDDDTAFNERTSRAKDSKNDPYKKDNRDAPTA